MGKSNEKNTLPEPPAQTEQVRQALQSAAHTESDLCALYGLTQQEVWQAIYEIRNGGQKVDYTNGHFYIQMGMSG
jgi:biotin operon repressor